MAKGEQPVKKTMTLPVAVAVAIIGCVLAVSANVTTSKTVEDLKQERYKRMLAEEQFQKAKNDVSALSSQLSDSQAKIESIERILNQGKTVTQKLEQDLSAVQAEKATLLQELQEMQERSQGPGQETSSP
jgi:septal ring factor EnvC (AmiA/AmiB activator)